MLIAILPFKVQTKLETNFCREALKIIEKGERKSKITVKNAICKNHQETRSPVHNNPGRSFS
jgi:hypothetical protein